MKDQKIMTWSWRLIGPFLISFIIGAKNFLPTFQLMPRSSIDLRRELDPEDSISREGISDERSRDLGNMDLDPSSVTPVQLSQSQRHPIT